jgi:hypothetical protein
MVIDLTFEVSLEYAISAEITRLGIVEFKFSRHNRWLGEWTFNAHPSYQTEAETLARLMEYYSWEKFNLIAGDSASS